MTFDPTLCARRIHEQRERLGLTQAQLADELVRISVRLVGLASGANDRLVRSWERAERRPGPFYQRLLCEFFRTTPAELGFHAPLPAETEQFSVAKLTGAEEDDDVRRRQFLECMATTLFAGQPVERIRHAVDVGHGPAGLDLSEWERTAHAYSRDLVAAPAAQVLPHLVADYDEAAQLLNRSWPDSDRRRLTHVVGQLAALAATGFVQLGEHQSARRWWRAARSAADQAGDPTLAAFVRGQQAMAALYAAYPPAQVLDLAAEAEAAAGGVPCSGLAEALAARAQTLGVIGEERHAQDALGALGTVAQQLPASVSGDRESRFGWPEYRLHHTESYTWTRLGDARHAGEAQGQALSLYPPTVWRGPAQIRLHRAAGVVADGDLSGGVGYATEVLHALPAQRRSDGYVQPVAQAVVASLPEKARRLPVVQEYRELVALPAGHPAT